MPNVSKLLGPFLLGSFFNCILYGVCVVQAFTYYRTYKRDAPWMRYFVLYLFILETINTGCDIGLAYQPLIIDFGEQKSLTILPLMLAADPIITGLISTSAQFFISWRIRIISGSYIMPVIIIFFGIGAFAGAIALTIFTAVFPEYAKFHQFEWSIVTWLTATAISDILITITLTWSLMKRKTGVKATDDRVAKIIRFTIHTGLLTAAMAIADVVVFLAVKDTTLNFVWDLPLAKVYANALLSTLNARSADRHTHSGATMSASSGGDNDNVLFGRPEKLAWQRKSVVDHHTNYRSGSNIELETHRFPTNSGKRGFPEGIGMTTVIERVVDEDPDIKHDFVEV